MSELLLLQGKLWKVIAYMMVAICKLHLAYSCRTDLVVKVNNDRSRDYSIPDTGVLPSPQTPSMPTHSIGWQSNPQPGAVYASAQMGPQAAQYNGQMMGWNPSLQSGMPAFRGTPITSIPSPVHQYPPTRYMGNPSAETSQGAQLSPYGHQTNTLAPPGQSSVYYSK